MCGLPGALNLPTQIIDKTLSRPSPGEHKGDPSGGIQNPSAAASFSIRNRDPPVLPGAAPVPLARAAAPHLFLMPAALLRGTPAAPGCGTEVEAKLGQDHPLRHCRGKNEAPNWFCGVSRLQLSPRRHFPGPGAAGGKEPRPQQLRGVRRGGAERFHGLGGSAGETGPAAAPVGPASASR